MFSSFLATSSTMLIVGFVIMALLLVFVVFMAMRGKQSISYQETEDENEFSDEESDAYYEAKSEQVGGILGECETVWHALIPYPVGGPVHVHIYQGEYEGTAFATQELVAPDGSGPMPNDLGVYELVTFTREKAADLYAGPQEGDPFWTAIERQRRIMTAIARYSEMAVLKPFETLEFPADFGDEPIAGACMLFDVYPEDGKVFELAGHRHSLLLIVEIFRSEMNYAREHGTAELVGKLKEAGHYPYGDLNREPVV